MDEHRKIELQSPADLAHIEANIRRAAREKLDLHLPTVEGAGEDELRKKVEEMVDAFMREVGRGLRANVWVNGLDVEAEAKGDGDRMEGVVEEGEFYAFSV